MNNVTPQNPPEPPLPTPLSIAVGFCVFTALGVGALAFLWVLSYLPLVGGIFAYILDAILGVLGGLRDMVVWLMVLAVKSMITVLVVGFVASVFKQNLVRIGLVAIFVAWFWTGWFDDPHVPARYDPEMQRAIEFGEALERMKLWNDWHSDYFRQ